MNSKSQYSISQFQKISYLSIFFVLLGVIAIIFLSDASLYSLFTQVSAQGAANDTLDTSGALHETAWEVLKHAVNPKSIIRHGGLWLLAAVIFAETGLLVGFFLPGDSLLFTAGLLAADPTIHSDHIFGFNIYSVLFFITIAAVLGDSFGYYIGKRTGKKVFNRPESLLFKPEYVTTTQNFYKKYGDKALILGRFLPIVRTFAPVFAGVASLEYKRFISYNVIGGVLWVFSLAFGGYILGIKFPWIQQYYEYFVFGFIIITTVPIIRMVVKESKERKNREKIENFEKIEGKSEIDL